MTHLGWAQTQAEEFRASIGQGIFHPVRQDFVGQMNAKIG